MNIPVAHIQGGEVTGTIDESIRHAMSKFAHYHFASNEDAKQRLIKLGELPNNIFNVGCPSIDAIMRTKDDPSVLEKFDLKENNYFILLQHPVTSEYENSKAQILVTIAALKKARVNVLVISPNNDAGHSKIINELKNSSFKLVESLNLKEYVNLLKRSTGLIGNSSSGIHETSSFNIPTVNIGTRQIGRLRPKNVIDVDHNEEEIIGAIHKCIRIKKAKTKFENPYGDGESSIRILDILKKLDLSSKVIQKKITY